MTKISELFGISTTLEPAPIWKNITTKCDCPYIKRQCTKGRKGDSSVLLGTCTVAAGRERNRVIICPNRLLERRQIFVDCVHLLLLHEPGNELHLLPEITIPGGSVDYFLTSVTPDGKVRDFVGIELQTLDTTGTVWPERQRFLDSVGLKVSKKDVDCTDPFGMNWKMTAKTILMQLHHKIETFENVNKHLVLVLQDQLLAYMEGGFTFAHLKKTALPGDAMHFHSYVLEEKPDNALKLKLSARHSTNAAGVATALGLKGNAKVELTEILEILQTQISAATLFDHFTDFAPQTKPS